MLGVNSPVFSENIQKYRMSSSNAGVRRCIDYAKEPTDTAWATQESGMIWCDSKSDTLYDPLAL